MRQRGRGRRRRGMVQLADAARILDIPVEDVMELAEDGQFAECLIDDRGVWFRRSTLVALAKKADAAAAMPYVGLKRGRAA